jgi:serine/threonine protein kinase
MFLQTPNLIPGMDSNNLPLPLLPTGSPPKHIVGMVTGLKRGNDESSAMEAKHRHLLEFHPHSRLMTDFELINVLGTGVFGTVYRARSKLDDVMYAIKRSRRRFRDSEDKNKMMHEVSDFLLILFVLFLLLLLLLLLLLIFFFRIILGTHFSCHCCERRFRIIEHHRTLLQFMD